MTSPELQIRKLILVYTVINLRALVTDTLAGNGARLMEKRKEARPEGMTVIQFYWKSWGAAGGPGKLYFSLHFVRFYQSRAA